MAFFFRYLSTLYSHPDWPEKCPKELRKELQDSIKSNPLWLLNPASMYRYWSRIMSKRSQGQPVSFTDLFGHLVGETLLQGVSIYNKNPKISYLRKITVIILKVEQFNMVLPLDNVFNKCRRNGKQCRPSVDPD